MGAITTAFTYLLRNNCLFAFHWPNALVQNEKWFAEFFNQT
jgi:hypothetical protein